MKSIVKRITAATIATFCLVVMGLSGCGSNDDSSSTAGSSSAASTAAGSSAAGSSEDSSTATELTGSISTGGSTSMEQVISALQEAFAETYPDVDITYEPTGSSSGITGASEGSLDIGLSSRDLHDDETGVTATEIALDGISIIVSNDNPISDLSLEDLARIATGEVTNWSELGGNDAEIVFVGREAGSGTRDGFESIVGVEDECVYSEELTATGAVIARVQSNPNAIGYASLSAVDDSVKTLTIDGVAPSEETVLDGSYKIQRPFNFITKDGAEQSDAVKTFIEFATSEDAAELIRTAGAVPLA